MRSPKIVAGRTGHEPIALPWLMLPALIVLGMVLVTFVRPDPKEIGMNLERYYPDYMPPPKLRAPRSSPTFSALRALAPRADRGSRSSRTAPARATCRS